MIGIDPNQPLITRAMLCPAGAVRFDRSPDGNELRNYGQGGGPRPGLGFSADAEQSPKLRHFCPLSSGRSLSVRAKLPRSLTALGLFSQRSVRSMVVRALDSLGGELRENCTLPLGHNPFADTKSEQGAEAWLDPFWLCHLPTNGRKVLHAAIGSGEYISDGPRRLNNT